MGFFDGAIMWVIGLLVVAIIAVSVVIPSTLTAIASVETQGTATGELWAGTAATAHAMAFAPIVTVSAFRLSTTHTANNTTAIVVNTTSNTVNFTIPANIVRTGEIWNNVTIGIKPGTGTNATTNITWVAGTCRTLNATFASATLQTYDGINSTCLPAAGSTLTLTFANSTVAGEPAPNVSYVTFTYFTYDTSTAYTSNLAAGTITPTASGNYYTTYTHGTAGTGNAVVILNLVPLMIGVVLLLLVITSATWMQGL